MAALDVEKWLTERKQQQQQQEIPKRTQYIQERS
jgi:hypothetical protein